MVIKNCIIKYYIFGIKTLFFIKKYKILLVISGNVFNNIVNVLIL